MNDEVVGVIGVGLLGTAIAERLLEQGRAVSVFDVRASQCEPLAQCGAATCSSVADLFQRASRVILSLPTSDIVRAVLRDNESAIDHQIVLDTTTGAPDEMTAIGKSLRKLGSQYVEANVAGSSAQMKNGEITLFLGGDLAAIEAARPVLEALATRRFHLGPVGAASRFKLVHNLILGLHRAVLAEGLGFAESLGFDAQQALEVLLATPAASAVMMTKGSQMASADYPVQARLSQHLKDVRLILDAARESGAYTPLSQLHETLLAAAEEMGLGTSDNSAVMEVFRQRK